MTTSTDPPPASGAELAADLGVDVASLDKELVEIDMLIGQARAEAVRHEQKRAQLAEKLASAESGEGADAWSQLVTLTRRSVLMEAQVDVLEGKRRALARHREALGELVDALDALPAAGEARVARRARRRRSVAVAGRPERPGGPPPRHRARDA